MFLSADTLSYLFGLGLEGEQLVELVRRLEADARAMQPVVDESREAKRIRDRDRMREKRLSRDIASDSRGDILPLPPETEVSPTPPSRTQTTNPIQTPPIVPLSPSKSRATKRCPDDWMPSHADLAVAASEGFTPGEIDRELAKIRDYQFASARSDWSAVFRNWIRTAADRKPKLVSPNGQPPRSAKLDAKQANMERAFRGAESAFARRPD